ncbi:tetratricopeptide repeat protein [Flagellimonas meridianipacifica]|uniref:Tetratricopeptide repeat protein n=1 Tax=Flagellimonas meridianipacifica TaxID=1080225 RepID=A0A2T0MK13_9FLAO|nr:tetratricopeptide repeat protein [Allomuricauda pacifica]PRX57895.1 tetratricopeptide repeat protein [Allomuricauda pacifica]
MNRYIAVWLLFFGFTFVTHGQKKGIDSLKTVFVDSELPDTLRFEAGYSLLRMQLPINMDSARRTGKGILALAKKSKDKNWEALANKWIGITHAEKGQFTKAHEYFFTSHELLLELDDEKAIATSLGNIGTVFYEMGDYLQAQDYLLKSLKLSEKVKDSGAISRALNNLGNVHNDLKNPSEALDYYHRSLDIKEKLGQRNRLPAAYNNIGLVYSLMGDSKLAIQNLDKSVAISEELGDKRSLSRAYANLGIEYSKLKEYNKALTLLNDGVRIKKEIQDDDGLATTLIYRGLNHWEMKRFSLAEEDCTQGLKMAETSGALIYQSLACDCLSKVYEALANYKEALRFNQRLTILKDSLLNNEKAQEITKAEMNYQFEKKQLADSIKYHKLQTEQQVAHERDLNKQSTKFYYTLLISLGIISFLGFLYWKHRQNLKLKKVENELLNSEIEFKKKDLTTLAVNISNNQEWAESLAVRLDSLKAATGRKRLKELQLLEEEIKNKIWVNKNSDDFYQKVDALSSSFYNRLHEKFEGLTKTEVRLCSFIKLDLNTKQIATLQNINPASVKMSRNRLRKKLGLSPEDDLSEFLRAF